MRRKIRVLIEAEMTYIRTPLGEIDYHNSPNLNATHLLRWVCPSCIYIRRSCSERYSRSFVVVGYVRPFTCCLSEYFTSTNGRILYLRQFLEKIAALNCVKTPFVEVFLRLCVSYMFLTVASQTPKRNVCPMNSPPRAPRWLRYDDDPAGPAADVFDQYAAAVRRCREYEESEGERKRYLDQLDSY
jgi:hypothetical protein